MKAHAIDFSRVAVAVTQSIILIVGANLLPHTLSSMLRAALPRLLVQLSDMVCSSMALSTHTIGELGHPLGQVLMGWVWPTEAFIWQARADAVVANKGTR